MAERDKRKLATPPPVAVDDLVFEDEPAVSTPVTIDDLVFDDDAAEESAPDLSAGSTPLNLDESGEAGHNDAENVPVEPALDPGEETEKSLWQKTKEWFGGKHKYERAATDVIDRSIAKANDSLLGAGVHIPTYAERRAKEEKDKLPYEIYDLVGKLADTRHYLGTGDDAQKLKSFDDGLKSVVIDKLGYAGLRKHKRTGTYEVKDKDGKWKVIDEGSLPAILGATLGDKYEIGGGMAAAKLTWDGTKWIKNPLYRAAAVAAGGAIGAAGGSLVDTFTNALQTGQKLTAQQYASEMNKAAALDAAGAMGGQAVGKVLGAAVDGSRAAKGMVDKAKSLDIEAYLRENGIKNTAKLPDADKQRVADALDWAEQNDIKLTTTSVIDHPQADQLVQVLARNPNIRQLVKGIEADSRDKMISSIMDIVEEAGPKAAPEELDALVKQELGDALNRRTSEVRELYDDFEKRASKDVVTTAKTMLSDIEEVGSKYGFREGNGKVIDDEIAQAETLVKRIVTPRANNKTLNIEALDRISRGMGKKATAYKMSNPQLHAYYSEVKNLLDREIETLSAYQGDEVAQALSAARKAHAKKMKIYGNKSEYPEIRELLEGSTPNASISKLLSGEKALDTANILIKEVGGTESGDALIGALGRKHLDDALHKVDLKSPKAIAAALRSDKMKVAKRLLGDKAAEDIDNMATLFEMMGRTEKLLAGAGSEIAASSQAPLSARVLNGLNKFIIRLQQKNLFAKVFDNTVAQDMMRKALRASLDAKTPTDFKRVDKYIRQTAKQVERETGEDFSDIYDKRKAKQVEIKEKKEALRQEQQLRQEAESFVTPPMEELKAVGKVANNDDVVLLNQSIGRIQMGKQTPQDVERYLKARRSIDSDTMEKALEKERLLTLPQKYRNEDVPAAISEIGRLRDYLMSHPELKYGNEFNPQSVNALLRSLSEDGVPRSTKHDKLYDDMREMYDALKDRIDEAYPRYSAVKPGEKIVVSPASEREVEELNKKFDFKFPDNITHTVDGYQVAHIIKNHGDPVAEAARGNIAITPNDIDNYMDIVRDADMKIYTTNKQGKPTIVYGKQVNGHFVVVEEVRTGKSDLALFTMWKKNGRLREDALIPSSERPGALRPETISSHNESIAKGDEKVNHGVGHGSDAVPLDKADPNMLFSKGLDNLLAGGVSGVSVDENGEITVDPERFIIGLGGYTAAKALIKNPRVQTELKELVFYALGKAGKKLDGSVFDLRMKMVGDDGVMESVAKETQDDGKIALLNKMKQYETLKDFKDDTVYHGTIEDIRGPLRGGGYDGVLWTARSPDVAQTYIPSSGGSVRQYMPDSYDAARPVRILSDDSTERDLLRQMGYDIKIDRDTNNHISSYTVKKDGEYVDLPTAEELWKYITDELGYKPDDGYVELRTGFDNGASIVYPADYKEEGSLYVLSGVDKLKLFDMSTGESDAMNVQYHSLDKFKELEEEGYDGVIIDDLAQSDKWGNVGHESVGLFPSGIEKMEAHKVKATNYDWDTHEDFRKYKTDDFDPEEWYKAAKKETK